MKNILFYSSLVCLQLHISSTSLYAIKGDSYLLLARQETYHQGCNFMHEAAKNTCTSCLPDATVIFEALNATKEQNSFVTVFLKESNLPKQLAKKPLSSKHIGQIITEAVTDYNPRFKRNSRLTIDQYKKLSGLILSMVARVVKSRDAKKSL